MCNTLFFIRVRVECDRVHPSRRDSVTRKNVGVDSASQYHSLVAMQDWQSATSEWVGASRLELGRTTNSECSLHSTHYNIIRKGFYAGWASADGRGRGAKAGWRSNRVYWDWAECIRIYPTSTIGTHLGVPYKSHLLLSIASSIDKYLLSSGDD